jgi:hypothetical protein
MVLLCVLSHYYYQHCEEDESVYKSTDSSDDHEEDVLCHSEATLIASQSAIAWPENMYDDKDDGLEGF